MMKFITALLTFCIFGTLWADDKEYTFAVRLPGGGYSSTGWSSELLPFVIQKKLTEKTAIAAVPFLFYKNYDFVEGITDYGITITMPTYGKDIDSINIFEGFYFGPGLYFRQTDAYYKYQGIEYGEREEYNVLCTGINIGYGWSFRENGFLNFDLIAGYHKKRGFKYQPDNTEGPGTVVTMYIGWELF